MFNWQTHQWDNLMSRREKMPHALLLRGRAGIGKHAFALGMARALLCRHLGVDLQACNQCPSCLWFNEGSHPDFRLISPEIDDSEEKTTQLKSGKRGQIGVAQIRALSEYLSLSNHEVNGKRIILISPADTLNLSSANALLKILEEPPEDTLFLLVTSQPHRLLPTIMSRCQALDMQLPQKALAAAWLNENGIKDAEILLDYAGGAPLLAMQMREQQDTRMHIIKQLQMGLRLDAPSTSTKLLSLGMAQALSTLHKWVFDLLSCKLVHGVRYHPQQISALQELCKSVNLSVLLRLQTTIVEMMKTADHPLNNEMQLENVLLQYTQVFKR